MTPRVKCKYRLDTKNNEIYCQKYKEYIKQPYKCSKSECKDCEFPILANVIVQVGRCDECPFCKTRRTMGAGYAFDYLCSAKNNKVITNYVEYMSELNPVPKWCPYYIKTEE